MTTQTTVYTVTADCGDYYCDGMHLLAVCSTAAQAEHVQGRAAGGRWLDVQISEIEVDAVLEPLHRERVTPTGQVSATVASVNALLLDMQQLTRQAWNDRSVLLSELARGAGAGGAVRIPIAPEPEPET